ncbi:kelch-like protein 22 isoform X3 [Cyclopterus lumpus]|uniref:kelch-like protein 22 isoform X3 n=1 Tax=Cyclopterus lumpus TaxID=8103 RepID=UPI001486327E|nr:kelch-like protein 22 isoform X3 [Cyclopterus lumpus]
MKPEHQHSFMAEEGKLSPTGGRPGSSGRPSRQTFKSSAHFRSLLDGLLVLRQSGILFDVVLLVEGRPIQAHRILLAASCDYFRGMFAGGLRETQQMEIPIHGVSYMAMKKILDYIYTSEIELDLECVQEVLIAATLVQLEIVISFCCDFLFSWLDESNILEVHNLADLYGLQQLNARVHSYILRNIQTLSRTDVYRQLPQDEVFSALSSEELQVNSENEVYEAALHYHYSPEQVETDQVHLQVSPKVFHPSWGEWRTLTAYHTPRMSNQGIAVLNNFVYLIGGDKNTSGFRAETRCWRYDPRHNSWCSIQSLQQQHADHCVCVMGGYIYAIGGRDYSNELESVERYDPHTNMWEFVSPLKREVYAHAGAVLDDKMYITCGRRGNAYLRETYCFDPVANHWTACAEGPVERAWHGMAAVNGRIYVIGGSNDERGYRRDVLKVACFDPKANSWSLLTPLHAGHGESGIAVLDSRIYVLGGRSHDKGNRMKYVHVYNTDADEWENETEFKERVSGLAACVALMSPAVIAQARSWEQRTKASWEDVDMDNSEDSGED